MSGWVKRRFWKDVAVCPCTGGFTVMLDGRGLRTPARAELVVPTRAVAEMLAKEWRSQGEVPDPETMPATRAANVAIDKLRGQQDAVTSLLAEYGDSDLVCYRAAAPEELVAREAAAWDPLLDWAAHRYGARPLTRVGVIHAPQPAPLLAELRVDIERLSSFEVAAFHELVALSGSLIIALALLDRFATPEALWNASRVDEDWQIEQWGTDPEAEALTAGRRAAFLQAARFYFALRG